MPSLENASRAIKWTRCPPRPRTSLTALAHDRLREVVQPSDLLLDATAGNGHDTLFLANLVGPGGHVFAIDLQAEAIARTQARLEAVGLSDRVTLACGDHGQLRQILPVELHRRFKAVVFNLGYLPGGDHTTTTGPSTTLKALNDALHFLAPEGALSVLAYRGHPGGPEEYAQVLAWFRHHTPAFSSLEAFEPETMAAAPPILFFARLEPTPRL